MPTILTDQDLIAQLKKSKIDPAQKRRLEHYVPKMNEAERQQLVGLIEKSERVDQDAKRKIQARDEQLVALAQNTEKEMVQVVSRANKQAALEFEKLEQDQGEEDMRQLQNEINNI